MKSSVLQICVWVVYIPLQVMVISALWRGLYRKYWPLFAYVVAELLVTVAEIPSYMAAQSRQPEALSFLSSVYWTDEIVLDVLLYFLVIWLLYQATARLQPRSVLRAALTAGALIFAAVSLWVHYNPQLGRGEWMNLWVRDLSFCSMALDLALWTVLISSRGRDSRLLMVSGALGVKFAGSAIGDAVQGLADTFYRNHTLSRGTARILSQSGGYFGVIASLACLYFWWRLFRAAPEKKTSPEASLLAGATRSKRW